MAILNTVVGARLWLPLSLLEIAFRNYADAAIAEAHPRGKHWLLVQGVDGDDIDALIAAGPASLEKLLGDGRRDDPVLSAARVAGEQTGRQIITRDDLIAHLMLGFWAVRAPAALIREDPPIRVFDLVAARLPSTLDVPDDLKDLMVNHVLKVRNRVAHHEPLLFRYKHVCAKKGGAPKTGNDLVTSLLGALDKFHRRAERIISAASVIAPQAESQLESARLSLVKDTRPLVSKLESVLADARAARDARKGRSPM
ncbi:MAG TPA: hypothetical protein VGQ45_03525 [Gaiellales bacterium]|nr:hypothetical protein [Gaiellales bacterium]